MKTTMDKATALRIAAEKRALAELYRAHAERRGTSAAWESADVAAEAATRAESRAEQIAE